MIFLQICHTPDSELAFLDKKYVSVYSIIGNYPSSKVLEQEFFSFKTEKKKLVPFVTLSVTTLNPAKVGIFDDL